MTTKYIEKKIGARTIAAIQHKIDEASPLVFDSSLDALLHLMQCNDYEKHVPDTIVRVFVDRKWKQKGYEWNPEYPVKPIDFFDFDKAKMGRGGREFMSMYIVEMAEAGYAFIYETVDDKYALVTTYDAECAIDTLVSSTDKEVYYNYNLIEQVWTDPGHMTLGNVVRYLLTDDLHAIA